MKHYIDRYRKTTTNILSSFNEGVGAGTGQWAYTYTGSQGTVADDTVNFLDTKAIKIITNTHGSTDKAILTKTLPSSVNLNDYNSLRLWVYFYDQYSIDRMQMTQVFVMTDNSNYAKFPSTGFDYQANAKYLFTVGDWFCIEIPSYFWSLATKTGSPDFTNINKIRVDTFGLNTYRVTVTLGKFELVPNIITKSIVPIHFFGGLSGVYDYAKPKMDALGLKGNVFVSQNLVGTAGYMTLTQLQTLQTSGWTIGSQGQTGSDMTNFTSGQITTEIDGNSTWMDTNGLPNGGIFTLAIRPTINVSFSSIYNIAKQKISYLQNIFTARVGYTLPLYPDTRKSQVGLTATSSSKLASIKADIDIMNNNLKCIGGIGFYDIVASGATGNNWNQSDFNDLMDYIKAYITAGTLEVDALENVLLAITNYFSSESSSNGNFVSSTIEPLTLIDQIQSDSYFDDINKIDRVIIYYRHIDGREEVKIAHFSPDFIGSANWSSFAASGVWQKYRMRIVDKEGAILDVPPSSINRAEDILNSSGTMIF